jgi:hypothetical protein
MCLSRKAGRRQRPEKREDDEKTRSEERSGVFVQRENSSCSRDKSHFSSSSSDEAFFLSLRSRSQGKKLFRAFTMITTSQAGAKMLKMALGKIFHYINKQKTRRQANEERKHFRIAAKSKNLEE